ncbi:28782_t:CDS:2, partial [Gigaspora margarita]
NLEKINTNLQLEIQQAEDIWMKNSLVDLKSWWKIIKKRNSKEIENATNKKISRRIKERQRRTNLSKEYQDWQEVYEPKTTIKEEWYKGFDKEILEEE